MNSKNESATGVVLIQRLNEWWQDGGASLSWACKMLHCSKETFKDKYAGTLVRVEVSGNAQNAKWKVHPLDVINLLK